jgi:hypothetical protein
LNRSVSKECKDLIQKVCHLNKDKRYNFADFIKDNFVAAKINTNINNKSNASSNTICENLIVKVKFLLDFYKNENNKLNNCLHSRESLTIICIFLLEIKNIIKFINSNIYNPENEIYILILENNEKMDYKYSSSKYSEQKNKLYFEGYENQLKSLESELISVLKNYYSKNSSFSVSEILNNVFEDLNSLDLESHFFALFETSMSYFSNGQMEKAKNHFYICKVYYEIIILIRVISCDMNINSDFDLIISNYNKNDSILVTFIGHIFKKVTTFEQISERFQTESYLRGSNQTFETVVSFYREINKMLEATSK